MEASGVESLESGRPGSCCNTHKWVVGVQSNVVALARGWKAGSEIQYEAARLVSAHAPFVCISLLGLQ